jgi:formamidopyrimidine-DNA glycosylase
LRPRTWIWLFMPELPEVETTRRGIEPFVTGRTILRADFRVPRLRWPIPEDLSAILATRKVLGLERRAKYLFLRCSGGTVILHLGMTGRLFLPLPGTEPGPHDHVDIIFTDGSSLRFNDSRRFGALLWTPSDPERHPLIVGLGPEPFAVEMNGQYLHWKSRGRRTPIKTFIMDQRVLVGVGNIYASEALFRAGINPLLEAGRVGVGRYRRLAEAIRRVLAGAIAEGGTTLRDFLGGEGKLGYFGLQLRVYGRGGEPCPKCGKSLKQVRLAGRATCFCPQCQK